MIAADAARTLADMRKEPSADNGAVSCCARALGLFLACWVGCDWRAAPPELGRARRWLAEGRRVRIALPPTPGTDMADVLIGAAAMSMELRHVA
jgi:hypothetical protein